MRKDSISQSTFLILTCCVGRNDCPARTDGGSSTGGSADEFSISAESITIPAMPIAAVFPTALVSSFFSPDPRPVRLIYLPVHSGLPYVNTRHQIRPSQLIHSPLLSPRDRQGRGFRRMVVKGGKNSNGRAIRPPTTVRHCVFVRAARSCSPSIYPILVFHRTNRCNKDKSLS